MSRLRGDCEQRHHHLAAMSPAELLAEARAGGLAVCASVDRLVVRGPAAAECGLVQVLLTRKAELMPLLAEPSGAALERPVAEVLVDSPKGGLEQALAAVDAEARRLTSDPVLLRAVANLLQDCRDVAREGKDRTALLMARDYARRIPAYLAERSARRGPA